MDVFSMEEDWVASGAEAARARRFGDLVWADGNLFVYRYQGKLYVMEPPAEISAQVIGLLETRSAYVISEPEETYDEGDFGQLLHEALTRNVRVEKEDVHQAAADEIDEKVFMRFVEPLEDFSFMDGGECPDECETAPVSDTFDPAEVLHFIHEMAYSLREVSNLFSRKLLDRPFSMEEHDALREANELIKSYQDEYGVDMEADENLKIRLGS